MKLPILTKLLIVMLTVSIVPLGILGYVALDDSRQLSGSIAGEARSIGELSIAESTSALNALGEELVKTKAQDVARQVEIYLAAHPGMTVADLQSDPEFQAIVVQPVGETGYTTGMDADTLIGLFHKDPAIVGTDYHNMRADNPKFYKLLESGWGYIDLSGYYPWTDPDGAVRDTYGYYVVVMTPTVDNVFLRIGATVYIDEFSEPARNTEATIREHLTGVEETIAMKTGATSTQNTVLIITVLTMAIIGIVSYAFARTITDPLRNLRDIADRVSMGDMENTGVDIKTGDELDELAESFQRMIISLRYYMDAARPADDDEEEEA